MAVLAVAVLLWITAVTTRAGETTQVDRGAATYQHYCSTCHGDRGQGLTDEFRATWPPEDQNCWKSKCHAPNHPPEGFVFPHTVPPLIGPGTLTRFQTAAQLDTFIQHAMPYYAPGLLKTDQYWDIAAFLLASNNIQYDGNLSPDNAALVRLNSPIPADAPATPAPGVDVNGMAVLIPILAAIVILAGLIIWRLRSPKNST